MGRHTPPKLSRHISGQFITREGDRTIYLGHDRAAATQAHAEVVARWHQRKARQATARPRVTTHTVTAAIRVFLEHKHAERGPKAHSSYTYDLAKLQAVFGAINLCDLTLEMLIAIKADLKAADPPYSPATINHYLRSVCTFLKFAGRRFPDEAPTINRDLLTREPIAPSTDKAAPPALVARYIHAVSIADPRLGPWLALQYLACLRPREAVRLIAGEGQWHRPERGQFVREIPNKTAGKTGSWRYIVLSPAALRCLAACRPFWRTQGGYAHATLDCWSRPNPPTQDHCRGVHFLRHSAYQTLLDSAGTTTQGATIDDRTVFSTVRMLAGHTVPGAWSNYAHAPWHRWRGLMLSLKLPQLDRLLDRAKADPRFAKTSKNWTKNTAAPWYVPPATTTTTAPRPTKPVRRPRPR